MKTLVAKIDNVMMMMMCAMALVDNLSWKHSFKNRTGPPVEPEKTGTGDPIGLLSALDRSRI
jgi:hypothetical protein